MARQEMISPRQASVNSSLSGMEKILDMARWAPSGDNIQPWKFRIVDNDHVTILLQGKGFFLEKVLAMKDMFLGAGCLLETMRIAAAQEQRAMTWNFRKEGEHLYIDVHLPKDSSQKPDPLYAFILTRSVNRFRYKTTPLTAQQKAALQDSVGNAFDILWYESFQERLRATLLNMAASDIRLRMRETIEELNHVIDWEHDFSTDKMPIKTVPIDPMTRRLMKFLMQRWERVDFMNRYAGGTLIPKLQTDLVPGLGCAAHFVIRLRAGATDTVSPEALLRAGQAVQRFWLASDSLGLVMQPSFAVLAFSLYGNSPAAIGTYIEPARALIPRLKAYAGVELSHIAFMGRVGTARSAQVTSRSTRMSLKDLCLNP